MKEGNSIEKSIQFKEDTGIEEISYIDINIKVLDRKLEFYTRIFRKKTYSNAIIPNDPFHQVKYKMTAMNSMKIVVKCLTNKGTLSNINKKTEEVIIIIRNRRQLIKL